MKPIYETNPALPLFGKQLCNWFFVDLRYKFMMYVLLNSSYLAALTCAKVKQYIYRSNRHTLLVVWKVYKSRVTTELLTFTWKFRFTWH